METVDDVRSPWEIAIERGQISVGDGLEFRTIADVCRCFGRNPKRMQRCYISLDYNNYSLWCPKLAKERKDGTEVSAAHGIINTMSEDGSQILSRYDHNVGSGSDDPHVTFMFSKDASGRLAYRFVGVFSSDGRMPDDTHVAGYTRLADTLDIRPWNLSVKGTQ